MDYKDIINKYTKNRTIQEKDKDTFFKSMLNYFCIEDLKTLWHVVTHLDCAKKVFTKLDLSLIIGGILYVVVPLDALPDCIPVIGWLDDVEVLSFVLGHLKNKLEEYRLKCMSVPIESIDNPMDPVPAIK